MDQIRRDWSRDEQGWWSSSFEESAFLKVIEDGEKKLFRSSVDEIELETGDLLQYATHIIHIGRTGVFMDKLLKAIGSNTLARLTSLQLWDVGDEGLEILGKAVESGYLSALTTLDLDLCNGASGHKTLANAMASGHMLALETLSLTHMNMGDEVCEAYAAAISAGMLPCLKEIIFLGNRIGNRGAQALGRAMRLAELSYLHLGRNEIGDEGLIALADSFHTGEDGVSPKLQKIMLTENPFTEVGLLSVAQVFSSGGLESLEILGLVSNYRNFHISQEGAKAFVSALSNLKNLTRVYSNVDRFPALKRLQDLHIERNKRMRAILEKLEGSFVPATFSKVYICGNPDVGKTTLRKTIQRSFWTSLFSRERKPHVEQRTQGIDVSMVASKGNKAGENPITLLVWDMAGQSEYHLLHNALLPDLSSGNGNATSFIIVCSSNTSLLEFKKQLIYWLRFIASSCGNTTGNLRHVLLVVNNIGGESKVMANKPNWERVIVHQMEVFKDYLDINVHPFVVDVRMYKSVQELKRSLLHHARRLLIGETVPDICLFIEKNLQAWTDARKKFPVLQWKDFVKEVQDQSGEPWDEERLDAATRYLNEAGVVVCIDVPSDVRTPHRRLVVLNPSWFCKDIVGKMFLHQDMVNPRDRKCMDEHGSISISEFQEFFRYSPGDLEFRDLIAILLWLGLCYQGRDQRLYIPALIPQIEKPVWKFDHTQDEWVMGFIIEHQNSATALAPIALWHRFQVELALASRFNGRQDNAFHNGRYFTSFSVDYMHVLIEVSVDQGSPTFDDISIFVKPLWKKDDLDGQERKQRQVDLAKELVEILLTNVWVKVCPGVEYLERVVWPWPACQPRPKVVHGTNLDVAEVKRWIEEHGLEKKMQRQVGSDAITGEQLLSAKHFEEMGIVREERREAGELRMFSTEVSDQGCTMAFDETVEEGGITVLRKLHSMDKKLDLIHNLSERNSRIVQGLLQNLHSTVENFRQDWKSTCPLLIYVEERGSNLMNKVLPWKRLRLRFACEAMFTNGGHHVVEGQQGLDMPWLKNWARPIAPWLKVSLTLLLLSASVAVNVVLPGLGLIIPSFLHSAQWLALTSGVASAANLSRDQVIQMIERMDVGVSDADQNPKELYGKSIEAISKLLSKLTPIAFKDKVGLRKVSLHVYPDQTSHKKVVWICEDCYKKYDADPHTTIENL
ncbi:unnamed protein product [Calypogeia fissa]